MNKGIFYIPIYNKKKILSDITDEILTSIKYSDKNGITEAFFGEHLTDRHEKIASSLMMVATASAVTDKIKLGTLTSNLNFYSPAVSAAQISLADNLSKGRLLLGIGSGANNSDKESVGCLDKDNHPLMLEAYSVIKKILYAKNFSKISTKNFKVSVEKSKNKSLGLGYFNKLYNNRKNLEIIMPALGQNSYNVKLCAKNNWSIMISNFCSDEIIHNHIDRYLTYSKLKKSDALKKIKLSKLIFASNKKNIESYLIDKKSPYLNVIETIFKKLKMFNRHDCFGANINTPEDATRNVVLYGNEKKIKSYIRNIKNKYGNISSLVYVAVPKTNIPIYDNSLKIFCKKI
jgi:hypothetical protein